MNGFLLSTFLFAQEAADAVGVVFLIIILIIALLPTAAGIGLVVWTFYTYYTGLDVIPPGYRTMEPAMVFLLLIPCFGIVWLFFIVIKIPESFRNYFWATGNHRYGDCGAALGMWYAVLTVVTAIPYLGILAMIPAMICQILFLMKIIEMKKAIEADVASGKAPKGYQQGYPQGGQLDYQQPRQYTGDSDNPYASPEKEW